MFGHFAFPTRDFFHDFHENFRAFPSNIGAPEKAFRASARIFNFENDPASRELSFEY